MIGDCCCHCLRSILSPAVRHLIEQQVVLCERQKFFERRALTIPVLYGHGSWRLDLGAACSNATPLGAVGDMLCRGMRRVKKTGYMSILSAFEVIYNFRQCKAPDIIINSVLYEVPSIVLTKYYRGVANVVLVTIRTVIPGSTRSLWCSGLPTTYTNNVFT